LEAIYNNETKIKCILKTYGKRKIKEQEDYDMIGVKVSIGYEGWGNK
jgi:hypothetical protein